MLKRTAALAALGTLALALPAPASAQERTVKITGFGAKSGVVRVFGINSEAAHEGGRRGRSTRRAASRSATAARPSSTIEFLDDRCNAEEGISVVRRIASTDAFVAVGPTCSNVAESLFGILQKKAGDASDTGLQFPIIADVAAKGGLAKISEWAFRNVPSEFEMYKSLFAWLKTQHPGPQDHLRRRREGLRAFERHLRRDEGAGRRPTASRCSARANGCSPTPPSRPRCAR